MLRLETLFRNDSYQIQENRSALAQQPACLERTIPVSVTTNEGSPAPELTPATLEATYEKESVIVKSVEPAKAPPRVVLLVDTSGSMRKRTGAAVDVAEGVLSSLPSNIDVGLAFFSEGTVPVAPPTSDRKTVVVQLEALRRNPGSDRGRTALWSALIDSVGIFRHLRPGDAVYLISDAGENQSMANRKAVQTAFGKAGIRLFTFIFITGMRTASLEELNGPRDVRSIVESTGGIGVATAEPAGSGPFPALERVVLLGKDGKPTQLGESVSHQLDQLIRFYWVEIALPEMLKRPRDWKIRFVSSVAPLQHNPKLTYPTRLWPCS